MPEELTQAAKDLRAEVQALGPAMERHRRTVIRADRRSKAGIVAGIIGITVGLLATIYAISARDTAREVRELNESFVVDRQVSRIAGCVQYNVQLSSTRAAMKLSLRALGPVDDAQLTEPQRHTIELYNAAVDRALLYRDCSPHGIDVFYKSPPSDPALGG